MRIAYITADPGVPVFGRKGCSIHVQEVLGAMARRGAQIDLFASNCEGAVLEGGASFRLRPLPSPPKGELTLREQKCLMANASLRAALECAGPFSLVYERYSLWSFAGMEYARQRNTPGLLEVNAPLIEEQAEHRGLVDREGAERVRDRVFAAATALLAVSDEVADHLESFPATHGRVHVVPNGVNPERFPPALEAFARLHAQSRHNRLLLVGDGVERERLAAEVSSRGLATAVQFTGAVAPCEVAGLLASMDVAVAPYPRLASFYFSPLKVYEYMAAGLPVVASRAGQLEKLIEGGVTGLLVPPGDVGALAAALQRVRREPELGRRLGQAARAKVFRDHTWDEAVHRILSLAGMDLPRQLQRSEEH